MSNYNNMYLSTMKQDYVKINKSYNHFNKNLFEIENK